MRLSGWRAIFVTVTIIVMLLFASPTISLLITPPSEGGLSELYILGSSHLLQDYPFNIKTGLTYSVYLGVRNFMGASNYYTCMVKFGNETYALPNSTVGTPSFLPPLYKYEHFISNGETWEVPLTFQVNGLTFSDKTSILSSITINGLEFPINKSSMWNSNKTGYYYFLTIELWIFNPDLQVTQYHNRSVHLLLNMTE
jgi:hypothetical protein